MAILVGMPRGRPQADTAAGRLTNGGSRNPEAVPRAVCVELGILTKFDHQSRHCRAAIGTRVAAEIVLTASNSVDASVGNLRAEIESFLSKVAV